jgi:hypothetical protein
MRYDDSTFSLGESADELATVESAEPWYVYFLSLVDPANPDRDFELVKVGITKNDVERRIEQLQTGNPYQIRCEASFLTPVARQVEHWVHRTNASRVAQLEWLRVPRQEIQNLVTITRCEAERLAHIAEARARWSQQTSNGQSRSASVKESQLHEGIRDVLGLLWPVKLRLRSTMASIALNAGRALRVPGVLRLRVLPSSRRFSSQVALVKFPDLAAGDTVETVGGRFRWRQVPNVGSREWGELRIDVERLEEQQRELDTAILHNPTELRQEGKRTHDLANLHDAYLALKQQEARLEVDKEDLQAQIIQLMEDVEAITDVCSFPRSARLLLNRSSFCEAHPREAAQCSSERVAYIRRRIYASRSY